MSENQEPKPTLTINGKEYFEADLNKNEARMLEMLKLLQPEIESLDMQLGTRLDHNCLLYTSPSPRDATLSRMPSSA